ncbi:hypothetical protein BAU15_10540 [Enterococcus sp. JM4C]|uniref:sensor histidine kinase n=1 Tax=Candidatus Enterococcus huntleyi TaxID=1857217 RepID=UPI001379DDCD|nr:HAMP domain-containing sensor histidine kinase [Enterococcus sp. JM4C]KAF1296215.1 hypothetical protein BAU15_10540 [Enterococcus sp. JM4C]
MKKLKRIFKIRSLFVKTWLMTLAGIFLTTGLLFLIVGYFADSLIYDTQETNFEKESTKIISLIKKDDPKALDRYVAQGYTIQIDENTWQVGTTREPVLPKEAEVEPFEETEEVAESGTIVTTNTKMIIDPKKNFRKDASLVIDGKDTTIIIYYPIALSQNEIVGVLRSIAPYFVLITLVVSSLIALGYAKYFTRKIKKINTIVEEMAAETYPLNQIEKQGDELQALNNHIYKMYAKLRQTMQDLEDEVTHVKKVEDSRRLFMSGITHELKTPIMNMRLSLNNIYAKEGNPEKQQELRKQLDYLTGMNRLVSELLELSRVDEAVTNEQVRIVPVLEEISEVYSEMLEDKKQNIQMTIDDDAMMTIPTNKLKKLFSNLLGNAIKYAPEQSTIQIKISKKCFEITNQMASKQDNLSIEDLHKPFVTTDKISDYPSHGLGLYLVKSMLLFYTYQSTCEMKDGAFIYRIFL